MTPPRKKVPKASVNYRKSTSLTRHCGSCAMYHANTCDLVSGRISPNAVCDKWIKK